MHPRLSVSAVSTWRWTLEEDLAFYAAAHIDRVGVSLRKLDAAGPRAVQGLLDAEVRVDTVGETGTFVLGDRAQWVAQRDRLYKALDAASSLGAPCIVVLAGGAGPMPWDDATDALAEALAPVAADAAARGVALALENTGCLRLDLSFVTTLRDAVDVARTLGIGVCVELNSCWAERDLAGTLRDAGDLVQVVQVSDFVIGSTCTPDRAVPGDGDVPWTRILGDVLHAGYGGVFDIELIGPRIEEEGYRSAVARSLDYLDGVLTSLHL